MSLLAAGVQELQLYIHKASTGYLVCQIAPNTYFSYFLSLQICGADILAPVFQWGHRACAYARTQDAVPHVLQVRLFVCLFVNPLDSLNIFQSVRNLYVFPLIHNSVYLWAALCRHIYLFFHFRFSSHSYKLLYHIIMWHSSTDFHFLK